MLIFPFTGKDGGEERVDKPTGSHKGDLQGRGPDNLCFARPKLGSPVGLQDGVLCPFDWHGKVLWRADNEVASCRQSES